MANQKPVVIITRKLPDSIETRMMELFNVQLNLTDKSMNSDQLIDSIRNADVLVPTVTDHLDSDIIFQAGAKLKLIANYGTGVDHIDLEAARKKGVTVTNTPDALTEDTADMTLALMLAVPRRLTEGERRLRAGE